MTYYIQITLQTIPQDMIPYKVKGIPLTEVCFPLSEGYILPVLGTLDV